MVPKTRFSPRTRIGNFEIARFIGAGGMGEVYAAKQLTLDREVALKILPTEFASKPGVSERFLKEVRLAARLDHPNIVAAYDAGEDDGLLFMAMSLVRGQTLSDRLKAGPMPERDALRLVRPLVSALEYAWNHGRIIHRDIKPANILLDEEGKARLADMGLSKSLQEHEALTLSGEVMGTPNYMSPEQAEGHANVDFRVDMYSLGATLYHMLTGQLPFAGSSLMEVLRKQVSESLPDPRDFNPEISEACIHLLEKMLAKRPSERHPDWASLGHDMDMVIKGRAVAMASPPAGGSVLLRRGVAGQHRRIVIPKGGLHPHPPTPPPPQSKPAPTTHRADPARVRRFALRFAGIGAGVVAMLVAVAVVVGRRGAQASKSAPAPSAPATAAKPAQPAPQPSARLTAAQQVADVRAKLRKLNPGFDGRVVHVAEGDEVVEFEMSAIGVTNIAPVADLKNLRRFVCLASTTGRERSKLSDLKPLAGLSLSELRVPGCDIRDLSPLRGMPLKHLGILNTPVRDLSPLQGAPLEVLNCDEAVAGDPSNRMVLRGMRTLKTVNLKTASQFWTDVDAEVASTTSPAGATSSPTLTDAEGSWVRLGIDAACNMDVISTESHRPADIFTYNGGTIASAGWLRKNAFTESGIPDDGRVPIPGAVSPGFFRVRMSPGKNVIVLTGPDGRQPMPVKIFLAPGERLRYSALALMEGTCWGEGVMRLTIHYESEAVTNVTLELPDWTAKGRTRPRPADVPVALVTRDTHPQFGSPVELSAHQVALDPRERLRSLSLALASISAPKSVTAQDAAQRFAAAVLAMSALPADAAAEPGDAAWPDAIDLLPLIDPQKDANSGSWTRGPGGLVATDITEMSQKLQPPYRPPEEYDYRVSFTPIAGNADVAVGLTAKGRSFVFYMKYMKSSGGDHCLGFECIDGKVIASGPTAYRFPHFEMGRRHTVVVQVRRDGLRGYLDGKLVAQWATDYSDMSPYRVWTFNDAGMPGVGCSLSTVVFDEIKVREVSGKGSFARPDDSAARAAAKSGEASSDARDLLPMVDPQKDAVSGTWSMEDGALITGSSPFARLQLPYQPPAEYDFFVEFTAPVDGRREVIQVLSAGGRSFLWKMGAYGSPSVFTFQVVGGEAVHLPGAGERAPPGSVTVVHQGQAKWVPVAVPGSLVSGQRHSSLVRVRKDRVTALVDGVVVLEHRTDYRDLGMEAEWALRDPAALGVAVQQGRVQFHRITVREVGGKGKVTGEGRPSTLARPGAVFTNAVGGEMVALPAGEFWMGSTPEERAWALRPENGSADTLLLSTFEREGTGPRRTRIPQSFWIGRTEVTVGQFRHFAHASGYRTLSEEKGKAFTYDRDSSRWTLVPGASWRDLKLQAPTQDDHPVTCIAWNDAVAFCDWLSERERAARRLPAGYRVRLPTEAEWEYACRGGRQGTRFWWGDDPADGAGRLNWRQRPSREEYPDPVDHNGERGRNGFGLADMLGNAREWCIAGVDQTAALAQPFAGGRTNCVLRGGAFGYEPAFVRCAARREWPTSDYGHGRHGFRVCCGPDASSR